MATFQPFCAKLDLKLDHHTESAWKPDPKAQPIPNEMNFIFNLNAFSWKSMKPTAPLRNEYSVFATTPCRGLSLFR
jgi:hypothetical protein